jgi:Tle cognate immunity protein 4 C-terminal domain
VRAATLNRFICGFLLALAFSSASSLAGEVRSEWKHDCVGRMQISFPGEAEVAAQTASGWKLPGSGSSAAAMRFDDGQIAGASYVNPFRISHRLSETEVIALIKFSQWTPALFAERAKGNFRIDKKSFTSGPTTPWRGTTWGYRLSLNNEPEHYQRVLVLVDQHLVEWGWSVPNAEAASLKEEVTNLVNNLLPRPTHTLPVGSGLCYPYLFVKDGDHAKREVATTYRLKDQPDITVLLQDKTAMPRLKNERSQYDAAKVQSSAFWTNYYPTSEENVLSIWSDRFRSTKLAGYEGVESYVRIKRADGAIDYGYYVSVRGSADAKDDEPDMTLYVIRDSKGAKAKGMQPYGDEKSFLALAKSIAASVKRRPTQ